LEKLDQLRIPMISLLIETTDFRTVAQRFNQLHYGVLRSEQETSIHLSPKRRFAFQWAERRDI
jgi:hypothetical protein